MFLAVKTSEQKRLNYAEIYHNTFKAIEVSNKMFSVGA